MDEAVALNVLAALLSALGVLISGRMLLTYWREREWTETDAPLSVVTMADEAVQTECFRIGKQAVLFGLGAVAVGISLLADGTQGALASDLRLWSAVGRIVLQLGFILTSLNAMRLRGRASDQYRMEQAARKHLAEAPAGPDAPSSG